MIRRIFNRTAALLCLLGAGQTTIAQTAFDGFTMSKGELCLVATYGESKWTEYWEGKRLRENLNIGEFKSTNFMPMLGYGITDRISVFATAAYISNSSDKGTMQHLKGWQDLNMETKIQLSKTAFKNSKLSTFATVGFSVPLTSYIPDFLPYSIGLGSKTAQARLIGHWKHNNGIFTTLQTGYITRSKIEVDRETYYTDQQYYSKEMAIPDVWDGSIRAGFDNKNIRAGIQYNWSFCTSGSDMRRNDMPYPSNRMNRESISLTALVWMPWVKGLAIQGMADQTIAGRNMGKAFSWMGGIQYVFKPFQKKTNEASKN
ncbi:hypothetical protein ACFSQD_15095 [Flavihumibacter stibioxidans]|uniref:Transporter n=1 Tax=Flavihumibacter stibioxidans TaxID=1834163 RepID=A0ABR7M8A9_9BACT|nr:hypothetical protein [Flavihumibacter stibioxidans]MBC6491069.1 hypothetical protein [Flavihumibacter stibioxidans]